MRYRKFDSKESLLEHLKKGVTHPVYEGDIVTSPNTLWADCHLVGYFFDIEGGPVEREGVLFVTHLKDLI